jgi:hypothetical protein
MSYHAIGAINLTNFAALVQPTTSSTFTKEALYWAQIRTGTPRLASLVKEIAGSNRNLSATERDRLRGEMRKIEALVAAVGSPSGSWSAAQLSSLRDANSRGGVPNGTFMSLVNKSGVSTAISRAQSMRQAWTQLVSLLGAQVTQTVRSIASMPSAGMRLVAPTPSPAPAPAPVPAAPSYVPAPTVDPQAMERAAAMAAAAGKTVGDLCALRTTIQGALATVVGTISVPSRGPMTADQLASLLNHRELVGMCSQDPSTPLSAHHDLAETYYALARIAEQLPMSMPSEAEVPEEWLEQHDEGVIPEEAEAFPWKWVVLGGGLLVVGAGGYFLFRKK